MPQPPGTAIKVNGKRSTEHLNLTRSLADVDAEKVAKSKATPSNAPAYPNRFAAKKRPFAGKDKHELAWGGPTVTGALRK